MNDGMWIIPMIGFCIMMCFMCFICAMMFFGRGRFGGSFFGGPSYQNRDYGNDKDAKEHSDSQSTLEILNKRYASGEITKGEYEQIKNDMSK
jgi:putative membrane protein